MVSPISNSESTFLSNICFQFNWEKPVLINPKFEKKKYIFLQIFKITTIIFVKEKIITNIEFIRWFHQSRIPNLQIFSTNIFFQLANWEKPVLDQI